MSENIQAQFDQSSGPQGHAVPETPRRIASADLLRGQRRLIIDHGGATYVLLLTRNGKLILNK